MPRQKSPLSEAFCYLCQPSPNQGAGPPRDRPIWRNPHRTFQIRSAGPLYPTTAPDSQLIRTMPVKNVINRANPHRDIPYTTREFP